MSTSPEYDALVERIRAGRKGNILLPGKEVQEAIEKDIVHAIKKKRGWPKGKKRGKKS